MERSRWRHGKEHDLTEHRQETSEQTKSEETKSEETKKDTAGGDRPAFQDDADKPHPHGMPLTLGGGGYGGSDCTTKAAREEGDCGGEDGKDKE